MAKKKFTSPLTDATSSTVTDDKKEPVEQASLGIKTNYTKKFHKKQQKKIEKALKNPPQVYSGKLNRRQRRENREAEEKALAVVHSIADRTVQQESLSCNWKVLQKILDEDKTGVRAVPQSKRRRGSSSNAAPSLKRRRSQSGSTQGGSSDEESNTTSVLKQNSENTTENNATSVFKQNSENTKESNVPSVLKQKSDGTEESSNATSVAATETLNGAASMDESDDTRSSEPCSSPVDQTDVIINSLLQKCKVRPSEPEVAWFDNVDPLLLEDDVIVPEDSQGYSSAGEDASDVDVDVDMDEEDDYVHDTVKRMEDQNESKQMRKRLHLLQKAVAMDCEMVGVGPDGVDSALARVSIVDKHGKVLYDKHVKPLEDVVDYRTRYSGIRPENLVNAPSYGQVQAEVAKLLKGRLLIGHALKNDLHCLLLSHPISIIRDTSLYPPFRALFNNYAPSLKKLCQHELGVAIQDGEHDSITDARAAMRLYTKHRQTWEETLSTGNRGHFRKVTMAGAKRFKGAPGSYRKKKPKRKGGRFAKKFATHGKQKC